MKVYHLNRDTHSRRALFKNLVLALVSREEIVTTSAKAKAVKSIFEKLLTKARLGSIHARRLVHSHIQNTAAVKKLVDNIAPRYLGVKGGYTKITAVGKRRGDNATMVKLALTKKTKFELKKDVKNKKEATAKAKTEAVKPIVETAKVEEKIKAPKTPVVKSGGRIGFRQGER